MHFRRPAGHFLAFLPKVPADSNVDTEPDSGPRIDQFRGLDAAQFGARVQMNNGPGQALVFSQISTHGGPVAESFILPPGRTLPKKIDAGSEVGL